jgi:hypothetical protein
MDDKPKRKRRWFQISLRMFLLLVTMVSAIFGMLGYQIDQGRRSREAVAAIQKLGGTLWFDYQQANTGFDANAPAPTLSWYENLFGPDPAARAVVVHMSGDKFTDAVVGELHRMPQLREVDLQFTAASDSGLMSLQRLTKLQRLNLAGTKLTDAGMVCLQRLTQLRDLDLFSAEIGDAGLRHLQNMSMLENLSLSNTHVTDAGLEELRGLTNLQDLNLEFTNVTDAGLAKLRGLPQLKKISVEFTEVSEEAISELRPALPVAEIKKGD